MKQLSVKLKLTVWLSLLITLLAGLLLAFMLSVSSHVALSTAMSRLDKTLRSNISQVSLTDGKLQLGEDFSFYRDGISTLIYSKEKALLAGQLPVSFQWETSFQNGLLRTIGDSGSKYLVLDIWVPAGWDNGLWLRGLTELPKAGETIRNLLVAGLLVMPLFIALAALGSYRIVKRSFRPLDSIASTAAEITEARDLSKRICLPPGKDEFSRLADTFDQLFERLEQSFETQKQFTSDASHELRTPVSVIKGACEYAMKYDETPQERQETLSMIYRQSLKMSALISQLLSITRLDQGTELIKPVPVDLNELLHSCLEVPDFQGKALLLEPGEPITVLADASQLSRLITNLVENAFKYGKPGGHVWVRTMQTDREVLIQVKDDGIGIPPEEQDKIWKRFYQVDPARSQGSGAGLGLSIVQQIAQAHKGRMTLESTPGLGSCFTLHLPLSREI